MNHKYIIEQLRFEYTKARQEEDAQRFLVSTLENMINNPKNEKNIIGIYKHLQSNKKELEKITNKVNKLKTAFRALELLDKESNKWN